MAVFTEVAFDEAAALAERLGAGPLESMEPIAAGIENTNYFLRTASGEWVLTLFERLSFDELPFYLSLMKHLATRGLPVPEPRADATGRLLHRVRGKPAALVDKLPGTHQLAPDLHHCEQLGALLARLHLSAADLPVTQANLRGLDWWIATVPAVSSSLPPDAARRMGEELAFQRSVAASPDYAQLRRGPIHADLFRDNVLFDGLAGHEKLTGVFDFYFAGVDAWLFDIAVCLNDWCVDEATGRLDEARASALVSAYRSRRPLDPAELRLMPALLRAAAFRFWISRAWDIARPRQAAVLHPKDPAHFERMLVERIETPWHPAP